MDSYEGCLELDTAYREAWYNLGVVYGKQRRYKHEIAAYRKQPVGLTQRGSDRWEQICAAPWRQ